MFPILWDFSPLCRSSSVELLPLFMPLMHFPSLIIYTILAPSPHLSCNTLASTVSGVFSFDQINSLRGFCSLSLSVSSLHRSQCSPGLTTWRTQSCWTWFLCSRASVRRRTFTVSYRVWGTGSRWRLQLALPASAFDAQRLHLAPMAPQPGSRPPARACSPSVARRTLGNC